MSLHRQLVRDIGRYLRNLEGSLPGFSIGIIVETAQVIANVSLINILLYRFSTYCGLECNVAIFYHGICDLVVSRANFISCWQCVFQFFYREGSIVLLFIFAGKIYVLAFLGCHITFKI